MLLCFVDQVGRNVEVYVDDIVLNTKESGDLILDLEETFANPRRFQIKLNPEKCVFGVPKRKLLGYMVSERGIEANQEKIDAIQRMGPIRNGKGVQRLVECIAELSHFILDSKKRACPSTSSSRKGIASPGPLRPRNRLSG